MTNPLYKTKKIKLYSIILIVILLLILILFYIKLYKHDSFYINVQTTIPLTTNSSLKNAPIDRTKLYGSLFLDNLNESVKNMSNPDIKYEDTRIELNKYSDILL